MNHATLQRMHFIDCLVLNYSYASRRPLQEYFGISGAQATRDFRLYDQSWPNNIKYNGTTKRWEKTDLFSRVFD